MKVFDLHCDTLSELRYAEKAGTPKSFAQNDLHIDLQKLKKGDYMLQCFAAFVNLGDKTPGADPLVTALEEIDVFKRIMGKYPEDIAPVYQPSDIRKKALRPQHRDGLEGEGLRVPGRDGASAHRRRREPPVRQGLLGHCGALHPPLCGQPLQLPRPRAPLPQSHRRDDSRAGR